MCLGTSCDFRMGVFACPIDTNLLGTDETLQNRYHGTMTRVQRIKDAGYKVFRSGDASLEELRGTSGL